MTPLQISKLISEDINTNNGLLLEADYVHIFKPTIDIKDIAIFYCIQAMVKPHNYNNFTIKEYTDKIAHKLYQSMRAAILAKVMIKAQGYSHLIPTWDEKENTRFGADKRYSNLHQEIMDMWKPEDEHKVYETLKDVSDDTIYRIYQEVKRNMHKPWQNIVETFFKFLPNLLGSNQTKKIIAIDSMFHLVHGAFYDFNEKEPGYTPEYADILDHIFTHEGTQSEFIDALNLKKSGDIKQMWHLLPEDLRIAINKTRHQSGRGVYSQEEPAEKSTEKPRWDVGRKFK